MARSRQASQALVQIGWAFLDYFSNNFSYTSPQEIIDQYDASDKTFLTDNFLPNVLDLAVNSDGVQVGIPYSLSSPVLYINRDLLKEAGLSEEGPKTWEEVDSFARTVQEKTGKYGFYMQEPAPAYRNHIFRSFPEQFWQRNQPLPRSSVPLRKVLLPSADRG